MTTCPGGQLFTHTFNITTLLTYHCTELILCHSNKALIFWSETRKHLFRRKLAPPPSDIYSSRDLFGISRFCRGCTFTFHYPGSLSFFSLHFLILYYLPLNQIFPHKCVRPVEKGEGGYAFVTIKILV